MNNKKLKNTIWLLSLALCWAYAAPAQGQGKYLGEIAEIAPPVEIREAADRPSRQLDPKKDHYATVFQGWQIRCGTNGHAKLFLRYGKTWEIAANEWTDVPEVAVPSGTAEQKFFAQMTFTGRTRGGNALPLSGDQERQAAFDPQDSAGLFVGVNEFDDKTLASLKYAVDDAVDMAYLFSVQLKLMETEKIWLVLSGTPGKPGSRQRLAELVAGGAHTNAPTFVEFMDLMDEVARAAGPKGVLLFDLSSHGFQTGDTGFVMLKDSRYSHLERTAVALPEIEKALRGRPENPTQTSRRLLFMDACRVQALIPPGGSRAAPQPNKAGEVFLRNFASEHGQATLCAADVDRYSYEEPAWGQGVFTHFVIEGLRGGMSGDRDGLIRLGSLSEWVGKQVEEFTRGAAVRQVIFPMVPPDAARIPLAYDESQGKAARELETRKAAALGLLTQAHLAHRELVSATMQGEIEDALGKIEGDNLQELLEQIETLSGQKGAVVKGFAAWWKSNQGALAASTKSTSLPSPEEYLPKAKAGNLFAMLVLRNLYGCQDNWKEWAYWSRAFSKEQARMGSRAATLYADDFQRVVERAATGNPFDQYLMARLYQEGVGTETNLSQAVDFALKAAKQGMAAAQNYVGWSYNYGNGVQKDPVEAVRWFRAAADQGNAMAQHNLGDAYKIGVGVLTNQVEGARLVRKAAEQGLEVAEVALGLLYENGTGVQKDQVEAVRWYRKAAEQGYSPAQYNLGWCYANGSGVVTNDAEAIVWFRKAADQDSVSADNYLGTMYQHGRGVAMDKSEAVRLFRKAAEKGDMFGQNNLAFMLERGEGVAKDEAEAVRWYRKAADQGYATAQWSVGYAYNNGQGGLGKDAAEAARWYRKAADQGIATAQNSLGVLYSTGEGVTTNQVEAIFWIRKAADQGDAVAQNNLGIIYENGQGLPKDPEAALTWYQRSADNGNPKAKDNVARLKK